jgi:pimeloyl-ACP methyl ester carboxylesterase
MNSTTFVLVHGAWGGGWHWRRVADRLRSRGHFVFAPTLTGLGERAHQLHPGVDLSLHIADVLGVLRYESLDDIVLVGHSYGGFVISGVAEAFPGRIRSIVFLDAFMPNDGEALIDIVQPPVQEVIRGAQSRGETTVPVRDAAAFRMNEQDRAWADSLANPQPIGTFLQKIRLTGARERIAKKTYIRANGYTQPIFDAAEEKLKKDPTWRVLPVQSGHDVMVDAPDRLVEMLLEAA